MKIRHFVVVPFCALAIACGGGSTPEPETPAGEAAEATEEAPMEEAPPAEEAAPEAPAEGDAPAEGEAAPAE
jgi:hypothetical protein